MFSRMRVPQEIWSDQGTNFMSNVMTENFNGILKKMLKAYAQSEPCKWDQYITYILFAYREVPNESTGFVPFELLYGRHIMAILKEEWEESSDSKTSVLS